MGITGKKMFYKSKGEKITELLKKIFLILYGFIYM